MDGGRVMRARDRRARLFRSAVFESLSRTHPALPALFWLPIIACLLWRAFALHQIQGNAFAALTAGGLIVWTFTEYAVHRFLFHLSPSSPSRRRAQFIVHGVHHENPADPTRLLLPILPSATAALALYSLLS